MGSNISHPSAVVTATPSSSSYGTPREGGSSSSVVAVPIAAPAIPQQSAEGSGGLLLSTASSSGPPSSAPIQSSHSFDSPHELAASVLLLAARGYDRKRILEHVSNACRESDMKEAEEAKKRKVSDNSAVTVTTTSECSVVRPCTSESDQDHGHEEDDDNHHHNHHPCQVSPVSHASKGSSSSSATSAAGGVVAAGAISPDRSQHSRSSSYDNIDHHNLKDGQQQQQALDEPSKVNGILRTAPPTNSPTGPPALSNTAIKLGASSPLLEAAMAIENAANMEAAAAAASANNAQQQQQYPPQAVTTTATAMTSSASNNNYPARGAAAGNHITSSSSGLVEGVPPSHLPGQLYNLLQDESKNNNVLQWLPDGKAWRIVRWDALRKQVLPKYFSFLTVDSFLAQLTEWGFFEIQNGPHAGAYQHAVRNNSILK